MIHNPEVQRKYRQSEKGLLAGRLRDRARAANRREHNRDYVAQWRQQNRDYQTRRYHSDDNARIRDNLGSSLRIALARLLTGRKRLPQRWRPDSKIGHLIGCDPPQLVAHIEAHFLPGMSWDNRGGANGWQIAHAKPCNAFDLTDPAQQRACFHHSNLRPLWPADNQRRPRKEP